MSKEKKTSLRLILSIIFITVLFLFFIKFVSAGIIYDPGYTCSLGDRQCSEDFSNLKVCNASGIFEETPCPTKCEYTEGSAKCVGACKKEGKSAASVAECCIGLILKDNTCVSIFPEKEFQYTSEIIIGISIIIGFIILAIILSKKRKK